LAPVGHWSRNQTGKKNKDPSDIFHDVVVGDVVKVYSTSPSGHPCIEFTTGASKGKKSCVDDEGFRDMFEVTKEILDKILLDTGMVHGFRIGETVYALEPVDVGKDKIIIAERGDAATVTGVANDYCEDSVRVKFAEPRDGPDLPCDIMLTNISKTLPEGPYVGDNVRILSSSGEKGPPYIGQTGTLTVHEWHGFETPLGVRFADGVEVRFRLDDVQSCKGGKDETGGESVTSADAVDDANKVSAKIE